jgi:hypothetical protein
VKRIQFSAVVLVLAVGGACAMEVGDDLGVIDREVTVDNGKSLNGKSLNGKSLNGSTLGTTVLWTSFEGVKLNGSTLLDDAWLEGTEFVGRVGSSIKRGTDFHQAEFQAMSDTGNALRLRARHITPPAAAGEPWRYSVEYLDTDSKWYPICLDGAEARASIAIGGWWNPAEGVPGGGGKVADPTRFTFACPTGGAIGKCIELGYRPWSQVAVVSLDEHHQSCVRALRADYCGDGVTYTADGKVINLYDGLGIQLDTEDWRIEAEWDDAGARCFSSNNRSLDHLPCFRSRASNACGKLSNFASGTLLMTEMP